MLGSNPIAHWRNYKHHYSLEATQCTACNKIHYPKEYLCSCGSQQFETISLSGKGKLLTFTQVLNPPERFKDMAPYCVGIVELAENVKITAQITDADLSELKIGMPVQAVFRKLYKEGEQGIIHYGIKFVPE